MPCVVKEGKWISRLQKTRRETWVRVSVAEDEVALRGQRCCFLGRDLRWGVGQISKPVPYTSHPPGSKSSLPVCPVLGLTRGLGEAGGVHSEGRPLSGPQIQPKADKQQ